MTVSCLIRLPFALLALSVMALPAVGDAQPIALFGSVVIRSTGVGIGFVSPPTGAASVGSLSFTFGGANSTTVNGTLAPFSGVNTVSVVAPLLGTVMCTDAASVSFGPATGGTFTPSTGMLTGLRLTMTITHRLSGRGFPAVLLCAPATPAPDVVTVTLSTGAGGSPLSPARGISLVGVGTVTQRLFTATLRPVAIAATVAISVSGTLSAAPFSPSAPPSSDCRNVPDVTELTPLLAAASLRREGFVPIVSPTPVFRNPYVRSTIPATGACVAPRSSVRLILRERPIL
jgi:hypothetical protein